MKLVLGQNFQDVEKVVSSLRLDYIKQSLLLHPYQTGDNFVYRCNEAKCGES